nr:MAG TPA: hypothetical protein [Caudoviricetes sp.]
MLLYIILSLCSFIIRQRHIDVNCFFAINYCSAFFFVIY